eukprot:9853615-Ditylum_brightwellii.AAC.1
MKGLAIIFLYVRSNLVHKGRPPRDQTQTSQSRIRISRHVFFTRQRNNFKKPTSRAGDPPNKNIMVTTRSAVKKNQEETGDDHRINGTDLMNDFSQNNDDTEDSTPKSKAKSVFRDQIALDESTAEGA